MVFTADNPKWSYVRLNSQFEAVEVAEKKVISNLATCGVYYFAEGRYFVKGAREMIAKNIRVNNEFYTCPVFNEVLPYLSVGVYGVREMFGLGTPEDLIANFHRVGA